MSAENISYMQRAIELAKKGLYTTRPNPRVGCIIVKNNKVIAEGFHFKAGEGHAELNALQQLHNLEDAKGATVYVTLEPCCHTDKRTAPCTDALIKAGIQKLVYGMQDPNPQVSGKGIAALTTAGIEIEGPLCEEECAALNPGFIKRMQTGLPYVRIKLAMSLDGRTAMRSGESKWITGAAAREDVQKLRARSCAIVTGIGTILRDDPQLNVRSDALPKEATLKQPLRVVLDRNNRLPKDAKILQGGDILVIQECDDLKAVLKLLGDKQCNEVLVEAGPTLAGAFVEQRLVDELIVYMAPVLMGSTARPLFELPLDKMDQKIQLQIKEITPLANDWRIIAAPI